MKPITAVFAPNAKAAARRLLGRGFFAALLCATSLFGHAADQPIPLEHGLEGHTDTVVLPTIIGGTVVIKGCTACKVSSLRTDATTQYFVGRSQVTLPELLALLRKEPGRRSLTVFYKVSEPLTTRIVVSPNAGPR
jgi:hypothetical protein